jgi:hypothetical protein
MTSDISTSSEPESKFAETSQKALHINLDPLRYGAFAEIGAGQEVASWFFRVGAASGTIAKSMSAYDMTVSDNIYGKTGRYVSKERLLAMLDHEYGLLIERLSATRGDTTGFFVFAVPLLMDETAVEVAVLVIVVELVVELLALLGGSLAGTGTFLSTKGAMDRSVNHSFI